MYDLSLHDVNVALDSLFTKRKMGGESTQKHKLLWNVRAWIHFRVPYKVMIRVQQLVLFVLASIGWHHCRTRNSISPRNWSTVMWPVPIGWWCRVSPAINNHQGRTRDPIGPRNWSIVMWLAPIGWWCRVSPAIYTTRTQDLGLVLCW